MGDFKFVNLYWLFILIPIFLLVSWYRWKFYKNIIYRHTLVSFFVKNNLNSGLNYKKLFFYLRSTILVILLFLIGKPQFADTNSKINLDGIDIILSVDVSGSMLCFDDLSDRRSRLEIAKDEAIRFINKRDNDQIGIVMFGRHALSRCPLTLDKKILSETINDLKIGEIDSGETVLSTSIITACNRLKSSKSKSKVIILLTDGEPTPSDAPYEMAIDIAKKLGIKIYTIGIGGDQGGLFEHPMFGPVPCNARLNKELLTKIAHDTGGLFFYSKNSQDMRDIYNTIDKLEKTKYDSNLFYKYYDFFIPLLIIVIIMLFVEQLLATFVWFYL